MTAVPTYRLRQFDMTKGTKEGLKWKADCRKILLSVKDVGWMWSYALWLIARFAKRYSVLISQLTRFFKDESREGWITYGQCFPVNLFSLGMSGFPCSMLINKFYMLYPPLCQLHQVTSRLWNIIFIPSSLQFPSKYTTQISTLLMYNRKKLNCRNGLKPTTVTLLPFTYSSTTKGCPYHLLVAV